MRGGCFFSVVFPLQVIITNLIITVLARGETFPLFQSQDFDEGKLGIYPNRTYVTQPDFTSPRLNILRTDERCDDGLYTMISLRGDKVALKGQSPMIFDTKGNLVWMNASYGETFGLNVQSYNGQDYLTFWQGDDSVGGHGEGVYILLDSQYKEAYRLTAGNGLPGDLHEFRITPQGTALVTQYILKETQITYRRRTRNGFIWDSVVQEISLSTNEVLFEWRASDHYSTSESKFPAGSAGLRGTNAYDFFHINSIDKDEAGNYLISSRYMRCLTYISGTTGEILWVLGGKRNNFTDLSGGKATHFDWQHDARWNADHSGITLFDNGARYGLHPRVDHSRAIHVKLDLENMTAELVKEYVNPRNIISASQGSMQMLESGNVLVGYGYNAAWTEYSGEGEVLCDVHVGSEKGFNTGAVQTYKVLKGRWTGRPEGKPNVVVRKGGRLYVSWNGATEVRGWKVEGRRFGEQGEEWTEMRRVKKEGFETNIRFQYDAWCWVRVVAIDEEGKTLETSEEVETGTACERTVDVSESTVTIDDAEDLDADQSEVEESFLPSVTIPSTRFLELIGVVGFGIGAFEICRRKFWKRRIFGLGYRALPVQA